MANSYVKYYRDIVIAERTKEHARDWDTLYTPLTQMMQIQKETETKCQS